MTDSQPATELEDGVEGGLSSDLVYSVLADKRRRYAIHYLKQHKEPIAVRELAEQVAAWENGKGPNELTSQERKRVYIALYQSHLPTLDKQGVVDYDADRGMVTLTDAMANRDIYLEVVPKGSVPWSLYYLGLVIANGVLVGLAWFDVFPFDQLPDLTWAAIVLVTFATSAFIQTYQSRRMRFGDDGPPPELDIEG